MKNNNMMQKNNKRLALIDAAVHLMVAKGDSRLVSTRAIVSMAQTSKSAIDYHFGNKAGLVAAVLDELRRQHGCHCISGYYNMYNALLDSPEGKIQFIDGLLNAFQKSFQKNESNAWRMLVRQRVIQSYHEAGGSLLSVFMESDVNTFYKIYHKITGKDSTDESYAWFITIMLPLSIRSYRKTKLMSFGSQTVLSPDYDDYFLDFCKNKLLVGWGLIPASASENTRKATQHE